MSEALKVEELYGKNYAQWQDDLQGGSARAMCVLAWLIWRRDGRDVPFEDITSGKADFDLGEMLNSIIESGEAAAAEAKAAEADPTAEPDPAGTRSTRRNTKGSSAST